MPRGICNVQKTPPLLSQSPGISSAKDVLGLVCSAHCTKTALKPVLALLFTPNAAGVRTAYREQQLLVWRADQRWPQLGPSRRQRSKVCTVTRAKTCWRVFRFCFGLFLLFYFLFLNIFLHGQCSRVRHDTRCTRSQRNPIAALPPPLHTHTHHHHHGLDAGF